MMTRAINVHRAIFAPLYHYLGSWFPGLLARFVFAAVLLVYFLNAAMRKVGDGPFGLLTVTDNAYFQILPSVIENYGYDRTQVPFFPYDIIVYLGTYSEIILPVLIVLGLLTRVASLGMMVFVLVQSYVDIRFHNVEAEAIGAWFDRFSDAAILDQRALWFCLLTFLVIYGPGRLSVDYYLSRKWGQSTGEANAHE